MALGLGNVSDVGARVGLSTPIPSLPATSIGAFDASLLEMTGAYMAFGNGGMSVEPHLLTRIETSDATVLWARSDSVDAERVLDEATAYVVLDAMRAVVDRGTGTAVRGYGYRGPAAGKTGTTNDGRDAWFVGLTPDLVAGVWIGFDTPRTVVKNRGGGELAAPAWATWMRGLRDVPQGRAWVPPSSVERVRYDPTTGEVIGPHCRTDGDVVYREAWVGSGMYDRGCPRSGIRRWLDGVWRALMPGTDAPSRPDPIGSGLIGSGPVGSGQGN
jgi:penicillin-binding protein 1A